MSSSYHGLILIDKPVGLTSHDVVYHIRKIFKTKEVGHSGTLDPLASGLMVVLLGEATKLSPYITDGDKGYEVEFRLGFETDTLDVTGKCVAEKAVVVERSQVIDFALKANQEFELPIPMYSAKKIDGKKLYEYARENIQIEVPTKKMNFWNIQNLSQENDFKFSLECSKGSFIRSWVKFVGEQSGELATMTALRRFKSDRFFLKDAIELDELKQVEEKKLSEYLVPLEKALGTVKSLKVSGKDETLMRNGQISHDLRSRLIIEFDPAKDEYVQILSSQGLLMAVLGLEPYVGFKIKRIFNSPSDLAK